MSSESNRPSDNINTSSTGILNSLKATLGEGLVDQILHSQLLLVGAGGIGCELLKNLALTGFRNVTVIDLDTIDVSNLNRQLLFRSRHVGQPKCVVACAVATQLSIAQPHSTTVITPAAEQQQSVPYIAHHGNVCDTTQFHAEFVKQYDIVLNALDNVIARRRVNRLCLATSVPLIEAGTTGYLGQVTTIHKPSNTACYECQTQETGKVYPICTIRSTPSAPVHCIVWAKELYKLLFGSKIEESMLYEQVRGITNETDNRNDDSLDMENDVAISQDVGEPSTYMQSVLTFRQFMQQSSEGGDENMPSRVTIQDLGTTLTRNLYVDEIQKQLGMDRYKGSSKKPNVLSDEVVQACTTTVPPTSRASYKPTDIWTPSQCVAEMIDCLNDVVRGDYRHSRPTSFAFDKDDMLCMRFVTAASNLRSTVFDIEPIQSFYSAKGIAGNIIPAIATTNAIVAGLQILQCFQVLKAQMDLKKQQEAKHEEIELTALRSYCSYVNCLRNPTRNGLFLTAAALECPNPNCFVCSKATISLQLNVTKWTLSDFITKLCKTEFGFENPSITMDNSGDCIWEEGDDADSDAFVVNLTKPLPQLPSGGIVHGTIISVEDFTQDLTVEIAIAHVEQWETIEGEEIPDDHKFIVGGSWKESKSLLNGNTKVSGVTAMTATTSPTDNDDDVIEVIENSISLDEKVKNPENSVDDGTNGSGSKRASTTSIETLPTKKKFKTSHTGTEDKD
jgi:ubiquitin-like 1-activating enzyme E1 B